MKARLLLVATLIVPLMAACGLKKDLDRPPPLWGEERAKYDAEQARLKAEAEAKARSEPAKAGADVPIPPPPEASKPSSPLDPPKVP